VTGIAYPALNSPVQSLLKSLMGKIFDIKEEDDFKMVAEYILENLSDYKIILLNGNLGAGKTTFTKYFCACLGLPKHGISSPTYSIVNVHTINGITIHHFDLYRIKSTEELLDIGFEDYLYSKQYCVIEWPDIAMSLIPQQHIEITISQKENTREVKLKTKN
jgi:tRNA threonylcarbamoyladenosine biosynthesis protein TsaE